MTAPTLPTDALQEQIAALQQQMAAVAPADVLARIEADIAALVQSGIAANARQPGESAPDFTLPDARGTAVTLSALRARGPVVVTFYRGEWCPYCNLQLRAYQAILTDIAALGASLVAISPQTPDNSLTTAEKKGLTYPVLSDRGNDVARRYGLVFAVDEAMRPFYASLGSAVPQFNGDASWELPMPGTFIIAPDGIIQLAHVDADWTHRLEPAAILTRLQTIIG